MRRLVARLAERKVIAPVSLIVSSFAPSLTCAARLTPQLRTDRGATQLLLIRPDAAAAIASVDPASRRSTLRSA